MFPALTEAVKEFFANAGTQPEPLRLDFKEDWYERNGYRQIANVISSWGGRADWSGELVNSETAQNHSVVWACKRIISESVAFLPLAMMQARSDGKFPATKKPMYRALHDAPNHEMTAMSFRETMTSHLVMGGNCYAKIVRRSGSKEAVELYPISPLAVRIDRDKEGRLVYVIGKDSYTVLPDKPQDILHVRGLSDDGIHGYSVLTVARQSIGTALAGERYAGAFFANGGRLPYTLKLDKPFKTDQDFDKFRADWQNKYTDPKNAIILEPWLTYQSIGMSLEDAQLLESRQFSIPEICRWFLISPHLVGDLSRATFSNIEHLALQFVKMTLTAWLVRWEQELYRCVLTPEEKSDGYYFKHNVNGLLRGDFASRMAGYASALQNGHMSVNEVRDLEDRNPIDGGDDHHIQLNMQTLPGGEPTSSQMAALMKIGAAKNPGGTTDAD